MKHLIFCLLMLPTSIILAQGSGDLDTGFDVDGKKIIEHNLGNTPPLNEGDEYARAIYVYPDGSTLIGGYAYHTNSNDIDMVVTKLLNTGNIDVSFGNQGHAVVGFDRGGDNQDKLFEIKVAPDGNILLIGSAEFSGSDTDFAVARLTPQGFLDPDFSGDGKMTVHFDNGGDNSDVAYSAYVFNQAIFVVGYATQSTGTDFAMTKIISDGLNDGDVDINFGVNGRKTFDLAHSATSIDKALKIETGSTGVGFWILGSASENDNSESPAILKVDFTGAIDTAFSTDGKYVFNDSRSSYIQDVTKKPNSNEFVFVGGDTNPANPDVINDCAVTYINTVSTNMGEPVGDTFNFNLDPNPFIFDFNSDCKTAAFSRTDSKLILSGNLYPDNMSSFSMGVMRLSSINVVNGSSSYSIDSNFATSGRQAIAFGGSGQVVDSPSKVAVDWNEKIIIAGTATNTNAVQKFGVARLIGNGGQDPTVSITSPSNGASFVEGASMSFSGTATDPEDGTISTSISWRSNIDGFLNNGASISCPVNFACLSVGIHLITARIEDSDGQVDEDSIAVEITEFQNDPVVVISSPANNSTFIQGNNINFIASASDDEDGDITSSITWNSSIDGAMGSGGMISTSALSVATHVIRAQVIDSNGQSDAHQITIHVQQNPDIIFKNGFE
ncbi:MAG TPA: Ig-like domain-containing protein [Gammaproteobacteria bacterium]|nr:hypothetical protein [Xanthomonadales bacterium]HPI96553.1 Ig-like domain-containing protein [Gammaproteobacteria bacterium]